MISTIVGILLVWVLAALVIFIVGKLGLGIEVDGFVPALIAAAVIAILTWLINWVLGLFGLDLGAPGLITAIIALIVAALVLLYAGRFVSGYRAKGFVGALIGAIAIGVVTWLASWIVGLLNL